jgi:hypothetical protein
MEKYAFQGLPITFKTLSCIRPCQLTKVDRKATSVKICEKLHL